MQSGLRPLSSVHLLHRRAARASKLSSVRSLPSRLSACAGADLVRALQNVGGRENFIFGETAESLLVSSTSSEMHA